MLSYTCQVPYLRSDPLQVYSSHPCDRMKKAFYDHINAGVDW